MLKKFSLNIWQINDQWRKGTTVLPPSRRDSSRLTRRLDSVFLLPGISNISKHFFTSHHQTLETNINWRSLEVAYMSTSVYEREWLKITSRHQPNDQWNGCAFCNNVLTPTVWRLKKNLQFGAERAVFLLCLIKLRFALIFLQPPLLLCFLSQLKHTSMLEPKLVSINVILYILHN